MFTDAFVAVPFVDAANEEASSRPTTSFGGPGTSTATAKTTLPQRPAMWRSVTSPPSSSAASNFSVSPAISPSLSAGFFSSYFMSKQQKQTTQTPQAQLQQQRQQQLLQEALIHHAHKQAQPKLQENSPKQ